MWDERYSAPGWAYGDQPNDFLVEVSPTLPVGRALCLAEGQGRNAVFLAGLGHDVTAMDQSTVGLDRARELAAARGVALTTVHADLATFDLGEGCWDVSSPSGRTPRLPSVAHCTAGSTARSVPAGRSCSIPTRPTILTAEEEPWFSWVVRFEERANDTPIGVEGGASRF